MTRGKMHLILKVFQFRYINAVMDLSLKGVNTNFEHIQIFFSDFSLKKWFVKSTFFLLDFLNGFKI